MRAIAALRNLLRLIDKLPVANRPDMRRERRCMYICGVVNGLTSLTKHEKALLAANRRLGARDPDLALYEWIILSMCDQPKAS